jgi:hypothetical protein
MSRREKFLKREFRMFKVALAVVLVAGLALAGCGSQSHNSGNINGHWTAALADPNGNPMFGFGTSFTVSGDGALVVSNFTFTTDNSSCSITGVTESGSFTLSGDFNGNVSGKFQLNVNSSDPDTAALTLTGTANGNTISGTWMLTGGTANCSGNGTFTMTRS